MKNTLSRSANSNMVDSVFAGFDRAQAIASGEDNELDLETEGEDDEEESEDDSDSETDDEDSEEEDSEDDSETDDEETEEDEDGDSEDDEESEDDESEDDESEDDEDSEEEDSETDDEDSDNEDDESEDEEAEFSDEDDSEDDEADADDEETDDDEAESSDEDESDDESEDEEADAADEATVIAKLVAAGHAIPVMLSVDQIAESSLAEAIAALEDEEFSEETEDDDMDSEDEGDDESDEDGDSDEEAESEDDDFEEDSLDDVLDDEDETEDDDSDNSDDDSEDDEDSEAEDDESCEDDEAESDDEESEDEDAESSDEDEDETEDDEADAEEDDSMSFAPVASMEMLASATAADVEMHLHNDRKNPHWNILVAGVPAARIALDSFGAEASEVAAFFVTPKYAAGIRQAMASAGVLGLLKQSNAEFYATSYTQSELFSEARASAATSAEEQLTLALASVREEFMDRLKIASAGMDKNLWPTRNPLKQKLFIGLANAGVQNPASIIESAFAEAGLQHFEIMTAKALELMDAEPAALEQVRAMVDEAGIATPRVVASAQPATASAQPSSAALIRGMMTAEASDKPAAIVGSVADRKSAIRNLMH